MTTNVLGTALITGASSGIGAVYADRLAKRGYDLILVARDTGKLATLAAKLEQETGRKIETMTADLTLKSDLRLVEEVLRRDTTISMLVNNAGSAAVTPLVDSNMDQIESMLQLNINAVTRLAAAAASNFVAQGKGTIINISSIVALAPELLNGSYGGSKAYVLGFTQSMHKELAPRGVRVQAVLPGATSTDLWDKAGFSVTHLPSEIVMSATDMVDAALTGLDQGEVVTIPALPEVAEWQKFDAARLSLGPNLSHRLPAARYLVA